jgi:NitT/TauT family transport system ATP-binding protein
MMPHSSTSDQVWLAYNDELLAQGQFAVEDINLKVNEGEFIAIVGPSGCGKSTFMKLATGLKRPSKGTVDHRRAGGDRPAEDHRHGLPGAQPAALAHHGAERDAAAGDRRALPQQLQAEAGRVRGQGPQAAAERGPGGYEDKFPWQLSGGMQQRASICRALIHEPKMLLLDEPFGALDAFTREELWCALRDLQATQKFNVILVTHDLRESVFLADTVYVMSKSPGRFVVRREIDLPRPRDLEVTYTPQFTDIVHELRGHIGAIRNQFGNNSGKAAAVVNDGLAQARTWSPWILLVATLVLWQLSAAPSTSASSSFPARCASGPADGVPRRDRRHAWRTFWVTMVGFGIAIVVGVLLGFLIGSSPHRLRGHLPADDRLQRAAQGGLRADPGGVVRHRRGAGGAHRLPDQLLPDHGQHRHRPGHAGARAGGRAAGAGRQALGRAGEGGPAALDALLLRLAEGRDHAGLRRHHRQRDDRQPTRASATCWSAPAAAMQMGLAFAGLVVVGAMAMAMYEFFSVLEKRTTGWAHRGSQG